jgi:hypothetical protein
MPKRKDPTPKKRRVRLAVIPEPDPKIRSILAPGEGFPKDTPIMTGDKASPASLVMECGGCGRALLVGIKTSQVQNLVLKCPDCGAFNETIE